MNLFRKTRTTERAQFARFHGRLMGYALLVTLLLCAVGPLATVCVLARQFDNGSAVRDLGGQMQAAARRSAVYLSELERDPANGRQTWNLQLENWRANLFADGTLDRDPDSAADVRLWQNIELLAVSANGRVLAATTNENSLLRPETQLFAASRSAAKSDALWRHGPGDWFFVAAPIPRHDGAQPGAWLLLRAHVPLDFFSLAEEAWHYMLLDALQTAVIALVIGYSASLLATRPLLRQLQAIDNTANHWARGQLSRRIGGKKYDEMGALAARLDEMAAQLETLMAQRQSMAATQERERLMGELHDSVKQRLFALSMQQATAQRHLKSAAQTKQAEFSLQTAQSLTSQIQRDLHRIISPPQAIIGGHIEVRGIAAELENMAALWRRDKFHIGAQTRLENTSLGAAFPSSLPRPLWEELRAIAAEALANAARHSRAHEVHIVFQNLPDGRLRLEIADDGDGFSATRVEPGSDQRGLISMRARAEKLVGGALRIESGLGHGCIVVVECQNVASTD